MGDGQPSQDVEIAAVDSPSVSLAAISSPIEVDHAQTTRNVGARPRPSKWIRFAKPCYIYCFQHGFVALITVPLIISLATIAQNKTYDRAQCAARQQGCGFHGNEDAYGLGIRIGNYLQWTTILFVTSFMPAEERALMGSMATFSSSLLVAVLVLTFQKNCTYWVEIIVMLFMVVSTELLLTLTATSIESVTETEKEAAQLASPQGLSTPGGPAIRVDSFLSTPFREKHIHGWNIGTTIIDVIATAYSAWFWLYMAVIFPGPVDPFAASPCGTSIFFAARIRSSGITVVSSIMAAVAIILLTFPILVWLLRRAFSDTAVKMTNLIIGLLILLPLIPVAILFVLACYGYVSVCKYFGLNKDDKEWPWEGDDVQQTQFAIAAIRPVVLLISIIGIELLLVWNGVSDVYSVGSTGQLIPLSAGLVNFIPLIWKLVRRKLVSDHGYDAVAPVQSGRGPEVLGSDSEPSTSASVG